MSVIAAAVAAMPEFAAPLGVSVEGLFDRAFVDEQRRRRRY